MFLNGFLLALLFNFYVEKQYEENLFASIASYVQNSVSPVSSSQYIGKEESLLERSVNVVNALGEERLTLFGKYPVKGIKSNYIKAIGVDLMTNQGACGSYAYVLGRLLQEMNIDVRFPQMTVANQSAGHILVEAKTSYGWVVLDPSFNALFRRPNGHLAGFDDVKNDWNYYKNQVPANYNMSYRYEGVRYTNWDKIPVVMPLIKNIMYWTMGKEKTDSYSLRSLGLNKYKVLFNITLCAYLLVILFSINMYIKARRRATGNGVVFSNVDGVTTPAQSMS